jgi:hypothetical protein
MKIGDLVGRSYSQTYIPKGHRARGIVLYLYNDLRYGECAMVYWFFSGHIDEHRTKHLKILSESS